MVRVRDRGVGEDGRGGAGESVEIAAGAVEGLRGMGFDRAGGGPPPSSADTPGVNDNPSTPGRLNNPNPVSPTALF